MKSRKGISAVVATVLIVLLTIVAITIVWAVIKPALEKSASRVGVECIDVDLSIEGCSVSDDTVTVTLNSGEISKLAIVVYNSSGDSVGEPVEIKAGETPDVPKELETKTYPLDNIKSIDIKKEQKVNVAVYVKSEAGENLPCGFVLQEPVKCI